MWVRVAWVRVVRVRVDVGQGAWTGWRGSGCVDRVAVGQVGQDGVVWDRVVCVGQGGGSGSGCVCCEPGWCVGVRVVCVDSTPI